MMHLVDICDIDVHVHSEACSADTALAICEEHPNVRLEFRRSVSHPAELIAVYTSWNTLCNSDQRGVTVHIIKYVAGDRSPFDVPCPVSSMMYEASSLAQISSTD